MTCGPQCRKASGYQAHKRRQEPACEESRKAYAAAMFEYRHRTGRTKRTIVNDDQLPAHRRKTA